MNKKLLSVMALLLLVLGLRAQQFDPPSKHVEYFQTGYFDAVINIINPTADSLFLECRKLHVYRTHDALVSLCANGECHIGYPEVARLQPVMPFDTGALRMHIQVPDWTDTVEIVYVVYDRFNAKGFDTLTYRINCGMVAGIEQVINPTFVIYPNPTTGKATLSGTQGIIEVRDLTGRLVLTTTEPAVDLSNQARGIYMVTEGNITRKLVVQ